MQIQWEYLTPPEFKKLAKEEQICILPIGSLERHGDHMPYGTDGLIAHKVACMAAEQEPCVVFPVYWFGQLHEASCFTGTVNFPTEFLVKMLEILLDQIAQNGFKKILILNGHGGNGDFLKYFAMSQMDREVNYSLYSAFVYSGPRFQALDVWEKPGGGHADEMETSMIMAAAPGTVKMDQQWFPEPIEAGTALDHLTEKKISSPLFWYAMFPENVTGSPSAGTTAKGEAALQAAAADVAEILRIVKDDTAVPRLQKEFYDRVRKLKNGE